jgi:hypothetical protein
MSAIGSYAVVRREAWPECLSRARNVHKEKTGWWIFKQEQVVGTEEFRKTWQAALVREVTFDYSGYVIGNYLDAQQEVNGVQLYDEETEIARALNKAFTAAFVFDRVVALPDLPKERLLKYCQDECGEDEAAEMAEAVTAAHAFFERGFGEITPQQVVVFIIQ